MKAGLLDRIRSRAYWRVNFRPLDEGAPQLTLPNCNSVVERSSVSLRGWDYPHISRRNDDESGFGPAGEYYEHWVDWGQHIEFWRMYKSSQYLNYRALWEDWVDSTQHHSDVPPTPRSISVVGTTYIFTEIFEFAYRLARNGLYESGAQINITLENAVDRHLWISEFDRMPFSYERKTGAERVEIERTLDARAIAGGSHDLSVNAVIEFFENFDWSPDPGIVRSDQQKLLTRSF